MKAVCLDEFGRIISPNRPTGRIKKELGDFIVREVLYHGDESIALQPFSENDMVGTGKNRGLFSLFDMTKVGLESGQAMRIIASHCGVPLNSVTYHGKKDARAMTVQRICVPTEVAHKLKNFHHKALFLRYVGTANRPLGIGQNKGNYFRIFVRCGRSVESRPTLDTPLVHREGFLNYYGAQRFGGLSGHTIGQLLMEGLHGKAFELMRSDYFYQQVAGLQRAKSVFDLLNDHAFEKSVEFSLQQFQSYLFNVLLSRYVSSGEAMPETQSVWTPRCADEYAHIWDHRLHLALDQRLHRFLVRPKKPRFTRVKPIGLTSFTKPEGYVLEFELPSGVYATELLQSFFELPQEFEIRRAA